MIRYTVIGRRVKAQDLINHRVIRDQGLISRRQKVQHQAPANRREINHKVTDLKAAGGQDLTAGRTTRKGRDLRDLLRLRQHLKPVNWLKG